MNRALIIVDVQNDFCPAGALATREGSTVAKKIVAYLEDTKPNYAKVVTTQDWHINPGDHFSSEPDFKDSWPPHCVAGTDGAKLHPAFQNFTPDAQFRKGQNSAAYSGFEGVEATTGQPLLEYLTDNAITAVDIVGIATDHCVKATATDALKNGFTVRVLSEFCAAVDESAGEKTLAELDKAGASIIRHADDCDPWN
ncbi:isochorismatase family protein [Corynebacterium epidermidicanis]|uniref:isochorismatase family protein n=1 Tax=Corynebacterium epidermidicanis TaxID=1050174 RepID=UPI000640D826|nr:isochorismatase family protein [Corynebacterium epidermidicanis]